MTACNTHWHELAQSLGLGATLSDDLFAYLSAQYGEATRHYHTATHITAMLDGARDVAFDDPDMARLAIFFHDVIYDAARFDNETRSAEIMVEKLTGAVDAGRLSHAARIIEATAKHQPTGDGDTDLVLDLDMAILGQPWPIYERYAKNVMAEYLPVYGEAAYRQGRVALFIDPTLARGHIYLTPAFQPLDVQAMANLAREKADLL